MMNHKSNSTKLDLNKKTKVVKNAHKKAKVVQNYSTKKSQQPRTIFLSYDYDY